MNRIIKHTLKAKLDALKGGWAHDFPGVILSYHTMSLTSTGENHFSLVLEVEAKIPLEIEIHSF